MRADAPGGTTIVSELLIILALVLANGLFSGTEIALISVRRTRLQELAEEGDRSAAAALDLRSTPERFLATVQIGITVVSATAAAFGGARIAERLAELLRSFGLGASAYGVAFAIVVGLVSYLSLVLGELVPKSLALRYASHYALIVSRPLRMLALVMRPLVWFLTASSNVVLRLFGDRTNFMEARMTTEELQQMVHEARKTGSVDAHSAEIANRAFEFGELTVEEVMIPRNSIQALPKNASIEEVRRVLLEQGHSRMPVYDGSIDSIVGYVIAKDLLAMAMERGLFVLDDLIRPPFFVPETMKVTEALKQLQRRRTQLAIVVDERGSVAGLVTVEDLLEELVGEIFDEYEKPVRPVRKESGGTLMAMGEAAIRDLNRDFGLDLPEGDFTTLAGLVLSIAQVIPPAGAKFELEDGTRLEVLEASPRRVRMVRIVPPPQERPPAQVH